MRTKIVFTSILLLPLLIAGCSVGGGSNAGNGGGTGPAGGGSNSSACNQMSLGQGASLNGFLPFPAGNAWNQDISTSAVDPNSATIITFIGPSIGLHPDFGSGLYNGSDIGIPYVVVGSSQAPVNIDFTAYGDESDPGPMPVPADAPIEGDPNPGSGDRHVLVLDNANCWLYELYSSHPNADGSWNAGSAAVWDLLADEQRPWTWTSADAAGLPIFAGLARYDEVASGQIRHALRFTLAQSQAAFVPPASHWAANSSNASAAPMGMRLRLKASYDISGFSASNQVILTALKKYGMIMADNGCSMFITGAPDYRWDNDDLHNLGRCTASRFRSRANEYHLHGGESPARRGARHLKLHRSLVTVAAGTPITLSWTSPAPPSSSRRSARPREPGDRFSDRDHHLHAVRDQSLRPHHGHRHRDRELVEKMTCFRCKGVVSDKAIFRQLRWWSLL